MFQSMCLMMSNDSEKYSGIWNDLKNITLLGTDNYPKTTTASYNVLCLYKKPVTPHQLHGLTAKVTLVQSGDKEKNKTIPGNYGR